jgi:hypothetical protein
MTEVKPSKPAPEPDDASRPFFEGALEGKLMLMRCDDCGAWRLPSRAHCDVCLSERFSWRQSSGRGVVRTFGIMHQRYHPGFDYPYNLATVDLDEGPRIVTNIVELGDAELRVGLPVVVTWERLEDVALPKFRPA